jgi:hypothetical protein
MFLTDQELTDHPKGSQWNRWPKRDATFDNHLGLQTQIVLDSQMPAAPQVIRLPLLVLGG